jgi:DNA polymerase-3 subunit delta
MKVDAKRLAQVVRDIPRLRVVCLYGDPEAVHEAARRLVVAAAGSLDDPFRVTACDGERREAIESALASPPLSGGRAVAWVRHATERLASVVAAALAGSSQVLLVLEFPGATGRSKVRAAVEGSEHGCGVACYAQAEATRDAVLAALAALDVQAAEDVVERLAGHAAATQRSGMQVGELAALYAGRGGRVDPADAAALGAGSGGSADHGLGVALSKGLAGDRAGLDAATELLLADGGAIGVVRGVLMHLQRLRTMAVQMDAGRSVAEAGRSLRPPLFFREERDVAAVLRAWTAEQLTAACRAAWEAERASKANGVPQEAVCRALLSGLARIGAERAPLRRG